MRDNIGYSLLFWPLLGCLAPLTGIATGYFVARKRGTSVLFGAVLGFLCGPCLGPLVVWLIPPGRGEWKGAGRSYGADESVGRGGER